MIAASTPPITVSPTPGLYLYRWPGRGGHVIFVAQERTFLRFGDTRLIVEADVQDAATASLAAMTSEQAAAQIGVSRSTMTRIRAGLGIDYDLGGARRGDDWRIMPVDADPLPLGRFAVFGQGYAKTVLVVASGVFVEIPSTSVLVEQGQAENALTAYLWSVKAIQAQEQTGLPKRLILALRKHYKIAEPETKRRKRKNK